MKKLYFIASCFVCCLSFFLMNTQALLNAQGVLIKEKDEVKEDISHSSAIFELRSDEKGILIPRMSTLDRDAITNPANGLLVFDINNNHFYFWNANSVSWEKIADSKWLQTGDNIFFESGNVGVGTSNPLTNLHVDGVTTIGSGIIPNPSPTSVLRLPATGIAGTQRPYLELQGVYANDEANMDGGAFIKFRTSTSASYGPEIGGIRQSNGAGDFLIKTGGDDLQERFRVLDNGTVRLQNLATGQGKRLIMADELGNLETFPTNIGGGGGGAEQTLFEVRNTNGDLVFAVYETGVRIWVDDRPDKSARGTFAVGGFTTQKEKAGTDYLQVSPGSTRIFIDDNFSKDKSARGTFAVGGFTTQKNPYDLLEVTTESTRIFLDDRPGKSARGTFAIGGFTTQKDKNASSFFNIDADNTPMTMLSQPRVLWYPYKNAFLAGQVRIDEVNHVGENSIAIGYESRAQGNYSQAMGWKAWSIGDYSLAIGQDCTSQGDNSTAIGYKSTATGNISFAVGEGADARGTNSAAIGTSVRAYSLSEFVVGRYNVLLTGDQHNFNASDPIFVIGNGQGSTTRSNAMTVLKNGNVGIGHLAPSERLSVSGNMFASGDIWLSSTSNIGVQTNHHLYLRTNNSIRLAIHSTGKVGVGTGIDEPTSIFQVAESQISTAGTLGAFVDVQNTVGNSADNRMTGIRFRNNTASMPAKAAIFFNRTGSIGRGDMIFAVNGGFDYNDVSRSDAVMTITGDKYVGIGTTDPMAALDIYAIGEHIRLENNNLDAWISLRHHGAWGGWIGYKRDQGVWIGAGTNAGRDVRISGNSDGFGVGDEGIIVNGYNRVLMPNLRQLNDYSGFDMQRLSTGEIVYINQNACPEIYFFNGKEYIKEANLIEAQAGKYNERESVKFISNPEPEKPILTRIELNEPEISYIDNLFIVVEDYSKELNHKKYDTLNVIMASRGFEKIQNRDNNYLVLNYGDVVEIEFEKAKPIEEGYERESFIVSSGYYDIDFVAYQEPQWHSLKHQKFSQKFFDVDANGNMINFLPLVLRNPLEFGYEFEGSLLTVNGSARNHKASWSTSSDARIKKDVNSLENALEDIMKFNPVAFKWEDKYVDNNPELKDKEQYGFVAQEVQQIRPEMVQTIAESIGEEIIDDFLLLNTNDLIPLMVKAIQEQQEIIQKQQAEIDRINQLQEENNELLSRLKRLEMLMSIE